MQQTSSDRPSPVATHRRGLVAGGVLLGMGLGGFVDGVVIHQILQWHYMGTATSDHQVDPTTVAALQDNTRWDGLFHAGTWVLTVIGLVLVWRSLRGGSDASWRSLVGLLLAGWGAFNLIEGLVNHQILGIHHLRDDLGGPLSWDLGFLAFGLLLVVIGVVIHRSDVRHHDPSIDLRDRPSQSRSATDAPASRAR